MAKTVYQIGLVIVTEGRYPTINIRNITAHCLGHSFTQNIEPAGYVERSAAQERYFALHDFSTDSLPLRSAVVKFREWLGRFEGTLLACCSAKDFFYLEMAFLGAGRASPFYTVPFDVNTVDALRTGISLPKSSMPTDPNVQAMGNHAVVVTGVRPVNRRAKPNTEIETW
jgi:hypothetical protein